MAFWWAMLLTLLTGGRIDYLPGARRPWVVDTRRGYQGRGASLVGAVWDHIRHARTCARVGP